MAIVPLMQTKYPEVILQWCGLFNETKILQVLSGVSSPKCNGNLVVA